MVTPPSSKVGVPMQTQTSSTIATTRPGRSAQSSIRTCNNVDDVVPDSKISSFSAQEILLASEIELYASTPLSETVICNLLNILHDRLFG